MRNIKYLLPYRYHIILKGPSHQYVHVFDSIVLFFLQGQYSHVFFIAILMKNRLVTPIIKSASQQLVHSSNIKSPHQFHSIFNQLTCVLFKYNMHTCITHLTYMYKVFVQIYIAQNPKNSSHPSMFDKQLDPSMSYVLVVESSLRKTSPPFYFSY